MIAPDKTTGWIEIPPGLDIGQMMLRFDTRQLPPWHGKKFAPPKATCGKAPSKPKDGITGVLTFEARRQGAKTPFATNSQRLVINNWNSVQILEITPAPCDPVTDELDVCFTFDHQFPRHWDLVVDSPKSKHGWQHGSAPAMGPRGAAGTIAVHDPAQKPNSKLGKLVPDWDPCVYRATLSVVRKLTNGYYEDSRQDSYIDFCKCQH